VTVSKPMQWLQTPAASKRISGSVVSITQRVQRW
jgi:hypothetical protein